LFPPFEGVKLCHPGRAPLGWGEPLNLPFCAAEPRFTELVLPFENDLSVCVFPFRCIAGADGSLDPLKDPRFIAPFCVREFAIICCVRCACWLNGRGVNDGLLCEKKCWLFRFDVRAIAGETLPCKRPRLLRVGATGRRPVMKLA
jgi:hypothetical protein